MEKLKQELERTAEEIQNDVYFKKILAAFDTKVQNEVPFNDIIKELEILINKMARRIPKHVGRIAECTKLFAIMMNESLETVMETVMEKRKKAESNNEQDNKEVY